MALRGETLTSRMKLEYRASNRKGPCRGFGLRSFFSYISSAGCSSLAVPNLQTRDEQLVIVACLVDYQDAQVEVFIHQAWPLPKRAR